MTPSSRRLLLFLFLESVTTSGLFFFLSLCVSVSLLLVSLSLCFCHVILFFPSFVLSCSVPFLIVVADASWWKTHWWTPFWVSTSQDLTKSSEFRVQVSVALKAAKMQHIFFVVDTTYPWVTSPPLPPEMENHVMGTRGIYPSSTQSS